MGRAPGARVVKVGCWSEPRWKRRATQGSKLPHTTKSALCGAPGFEKNVSYVEYTVE